MASAVLAQLNAATSVAVQRNIFICVLASDRTHTGIALVHEAGARLQRPRRRNASILHASLRIFCSPAHTLLPTIGLEAAVKRGIDGGALHPPQPRIHPGQGQPASGLDQLAAEKYGPSDFPGGKG